MVERLAGSECLPVSVKIQTEAKDGPGSRQNGLVWRIGSRWLMHLIEADKFDVWLVSIRVSMRLLWPRQEAGREGAANPDRSPA